jgi:hypothetical protein
MPTVQFEVADYDVAVEPWSPIKRRIVLRGSDGGGARDEATLLFTTNRTETGVVSNVDGEGGASVWAYFDLDDYEDVLHLLESDTTVHLHYGHVSGSGSTRTLYFVSVETTASTPGQGDDGIEESLPFGAYESDESLEIPVEVESEGVERVHDRSVEQN